MHPFFQRLEPSWLMVLTDIDLVRCWVAWRILPLSRQPGLMCEYTGNVKDPQRHSQIELDEKDINDMTKSLLNESLDTCIKTGLNPFYTFNEPPPVSIKIFFKPIIFSSK